jgi:hypothetical protein
MLKVSLDAIRGCAMRRRVLAGAVAGMLAIGVFAGTVSAAGPVSHYTFYSCTGPGVPTTFVAVKTATPPASGSGVSAAAAFRVVNSTAIYTVYDFGSGGPHGITVSGVATDWCWVDFAEVGPTLVGGAYHGG